MGRRLQARRGATETRAVRRLTLAYLAIFACVVAALSALAFFYADSAYRDAYEPALATPEGAAALMHFRRGIAGSVAFVDLVLLLAVAAASFGLARAAVRPLALDREREERFTADAAHELRTPLAAIAGLAQAAAGSEEGEQRAALDAITERALGAGALVADLMTLARTDGVESLATEPVDLAGVAARVVRQAACGSTLLESELSSAIVEGDERRLEQLVRNLLDNALHHARNCASIRVAGEQGWAVLSVEDDGEGVDPRIAPHLFERFAKGPGSSGTGLGLAICRWVARAHGGDVTYEGASRFLARIPLGRYDAA